MLNPAIAIGLTFSAVWDAGWDALKDIWIYPAAPFAGSLLALLYFEFVYKKT